MSSHPLRQLEGQVCDLADMSNLAADELERLREWLVARKTVNEDNDLRLVLFCVHHVSALAIKLKRDFYEKFDEGRRGPS